MVWLPIVVGVLLVAHGLVHLATSPRIVLGIAIDAALVAAALRPEWVEKLVA